MTRWFLFAGILAAPIIARAQDIPIPVYVVNCYAHSVNRLGCCVNGVNIKSRGVSCAYSAE